MTDEEFLKQFETCTLPREEFRHRNHLRLAWIYLSRFSFTEAQEKLRTAILRYASHLGAQQIYNETLTRFWLLLIQQALHPNFLSFEAFLEQNSQLLDKNLPLHYYSESQLNCEHARRQWLEPDLQPLERNLYCTL